MKKLLLVTYDEKKVEIALSDISHMIPAQWGHPDKKNIILVQLHSGKYYICTEIYPVIVEIK